MSSAINFIIDKLAKDPRLNNVPRPILDTITKLALEAMLDGLVQADVLTASAAEDLRVCEGCEGISGDVRDAGEIDFCPGCLTSPEVENVAHHTPDGSEPLRHPLNRRQAIEPAPALQGTLGVWHNGYDWVVATSAEDARDVACASTGERPEDYDAGDWESCAPGSTVTIRGEDGAPGDTRTCAEWVAAHGRGFLCTTEA